ncbi:hypothetical protein BJX64DRAFT_294144 [Aspergillus heterothallicus]
MKSVWAQSWATYKKHHAMLPLTKVQPAIATMRLLLEIVSKHFESERDIFAFIRTNHRLYAMESKSSTELMPPAAAPALCTSHPKAEIQQQQSQSLMRSNMEERK